jgi:hypothetical protein
MCLLENGGTEVADVAKAYSKWKEEKSEFVPKGCNKGAEEL